MVQGAHANIGLLPQPPDHLHKSHRGQRLTCTINHALIGKQRQPQVGVVSPSHAALSQVIPGGPYEIANQLRIFLDPFPIIGQIRRHGFRAHHDTVRISDRIRVVPGGGVVQTQNIELFRRTAAGLVPPGAGGHEEHQLA